MRARISAAALLAERTQRVYRMAVHELPYLGKRLVRGKIRLDNHSNDRLSRIDHSGARHDPHLAYQRVHADQSSNLRFVVRKRVGIELRCLVDESPVQLLPSALVL